MRIDRELWLVSTLLYDIQIFPIFSTLVHTFVRGWSSAILQAKLATTVLGVVEAAILVQAAPVRITVAIAAQVVVAEPVTAATGTGAEFVACRKRKGRG
jgi:hypothetical protein